MTTKNILCFGDSNTWGYDPVRKKRFPQEKRWTGILQKLLGSSCYVIEEGLNGRTTVWDDPVEGGMGDKNGMKVLPTLLSTHTPLDLILVMLGTNDLKKRFSVSAYEAALGVERLILIVRRHNYAPEGSVPEILIASPPRISFLCEDFKNHFLASAPEESKRFHEHLHETADANACHYINMGDYIEPSDRDGIHIPEKSQKIVAEKFFQKISGIIA